MTLHLDFETRSAVDLRKTGAYVYAESPTTDIWCAAFALGDEDPRLWLPGEPCPDDVREHIESGGTVTAHNAAFERVIWKAIFAPRYGWPEPKLEQYRCTMAMALALAMPGGLDNLAGALGLSVKKDDFGYRKMLQMSKPRKRHSDGTFTWWDDDERKQILYAYCKQDVVVEREVEKRLLPLAPQELRVWHLDQKINDRGVYVDVDLCLAAKDIAEQAKDRLNKEMKKVTGGSVSAATNATQLRDWVKSRGVPCDSVAKEPVAALLARNDTPEDVRSALQIRRDGSKTSVAKADALLNGRSPDNRARGLLQYHAATTGRWGGRRFQPQNIKRPDEDTDIARAIELILTRDLDKFSAEFPDPMSVVGDCLRGMVRAPEKRILRQADFSNIEGRVLAWLAGERWKLEAFERYDTFVRDDRGQRVPNPDKPGEYLREGEDLYKVTAGEILDKLATEVTKSERQSVGKVSELALGFQGGVGAMMNMSGGRVDFAELYDMLAAKSPDRAEAAERAWKERGAGYGAAMWQAAEIIKLGWRDANRKISEFWGEVEQAAICAVRHAGQEWSAGEHLKFKVAGSWLFMRLPNGKCLAYTYPRLVKKKMPWTDREGDPVYKDALAFKAVDSLSNKWVLTDTYGGKLVENATQATAREILVHSLLKLDERNWPIVLHVHDEVVNDCAEAFGSTEELEHIMAEAPEWISGCPIAAEGWSEARYQK